MSAGPVEVDDLLVEVIPEVLVLLLSTLLLGRDQLSLLDLGLPIKRLLEATLQVDLVLFYPTPDESRASLLFDHLLLLPESLFLTSDPRGLALLLLHLHALHPPLVQLLQVLFQRAHLGHHLRAL